MTIEIDVMEKRGNEYTLVTYGYFSYSKELNSIDLDALVKKSLGDPKGGARLVRVTIE